MIRFGRKSRFALALLCAFMVAMRVAGAHLHLCLDGTEPPVSLHVADTGSHHAEEPGESHVDRDVTISGDYVAKKSSFGLDLAMLAAILFMLLLLPMRRGATRQAHTAPLLPLPARLHLRPPLRGPPRRD